MIGAPSESVVTDSAGKTVFQYTCAPGFQLTTAPQLNRTCDANTGGMTQDVICREVFQVVHSLEVEGAPNCPQGSVQATTVASLAAMYPTLAISNVNVAYTCNTELMAGTPNSKYSVTMTLSVVGVQEAYMLVGGWYCRPTRSVAC